MAIQDNDPNTISNQVTEDTETDVEGKTPQNGFMTAEQFNKAMSSRERAFEKKMQKLMEDNARMLERMAPPTNPEPALSRTAELERNVKELSKNIQDRDARDKQNHLRKTTEQYLRAHGIDSEFSDHAVSYLIDSKQVVRYDADGQIVMTVNGMQYDDLDEGMAVWATTRDAKLYRKPTAAHGSGDQSKGFVKPTTDHSDQISFKRPDGWEKRFDQDPTKSSLSQEAKLAIQARLQKSFK